MRAGPKGTVTADPLDSSSYSTGRAKRRGRFSADYLVTPRRQRAAKPFKLRPFQREIIRAAFAPGIRSAWVSIPRATGMTMLAAALGPAELFVGASSAEVLVVASDQRQASIMLRYARPMVELNPVLAQRVQVYTDRLYLPKNDATLLPLPDEPGALRGHDPSLQIVDELYVVTEEVREAVTSMAGKRPTSLTLAISTAASAPDSVMWCRKTNAGRSQDRRRRGRDRGRRPRGVASNTKPQESEEFCVTHDELPLEPL
jgi:phage terminase large subunit-like protein